MTRSFTFIAFVLSLAAFSTTIRAQQSESADTTTRSPVIFNVFWENDSSPLNRIEPSDRHYTNGTAINISWRPRLADDIAPYIPLADQFDQTDTAFGLTFGQLMLSPENLHTKAIVTNDAPYAGYLYAGAYWQRTDSGRTMLDHLQLDLGTVGGPSLADPIQKSIHEWVNATRPNGWRHQIQDEPTIQLTVIRKWRFNLIGGSPADGEAAQVHFLGDNFAVQLVPYVNGSVGTVKRQAELGTSLRLGWNVPDDFGPARLADLANGQSLARSQRDGLSFYAFGRSAVRFVQHDTFLDGSDFQHQEHTVRSRPIVGEFQFGAAVGYNHHDFSAELSYGVTFLTNTFYHQKDADKYAAVSLKLAYRF